VVKTSSSLIGSDQERDAMPHVATAEAALVLAQKGSANESIGEAWLRTELLRALAVTSSNQSVDLVRAIEFVDVRQHVALSVDEVASTLLALIRRGLLDVVGGVLSFTDSGWSVLPRTKHGSLALAKRDEPRWEALLKQ
jgi:hypothetical protein